MIYLNLFKTCQISDNEYSIRYTGDNSHFSRYAEILSSIKNKYYDRNRRSWIISSNNLRLFDQLRYHTVNYGDIGQGLKLEPYNYQKDIIQFCYTKEKTLIVAPCGAGKTPCIIGVYHHARMKKKISGCGIIIVKASLKEQWKKEIEKFSDYSVTIIKTLSQCANKHDIYEQQFQGYDIYILNYESLRNEDIRNRMLKLKPEFVAADEAQAIKDDTTQRAKALYKFNKVRFTIAATATPVQKNPMDIFGIMKFVNPQIFPKKGEFGQRYVSWASFGQYIRKPIGSKNEKELNLKLREWMIIKTKQEISSQLPKLVVVQKFCILTPKQQQKSNILLKKIESLKEQERIEMQKLAKTGNQTSSLLRKIEAEILMYQTYAQEMANDEKLLAVSEANNTKLYVTGDPSEKTKLCIALIKEIIEAGEKVAVFSRFVKYQDILKQEFSKDNDLKCIKVAQVNGTMSDQKRYQEVYNKFNTDPSYKILLLSEAANEGLNLSQCGYLIEMDLAQSYAAQTQRHGRIERADSTHDTVYVYQLITEDSFDQIAQKIVSKKEGFDNKIIRGLSSEI